VQLEDLEVLARSSFPAYGTWTAPPELRGAQGSLVFVGVPVERRVRKRSRDTNATPSRRPALQGSEV
jgi:hypothetical protein